MFDFDYYNPTHIIFGENRLSKLKNLISKDARVMITFGGESAKKYKTIEKVRSNLENNKIIEFSGIEVNPQYSTLVRAIEIAKRENINFLLAVGGGSVMDGTKFIALGARYQKEDYQNLLRGVGKVNVKDALPLGCIVTLPATGSEMNSGGVITYLGQKRICKSILLYPKFSFLDPILTLTLPKEQIANGIADSFIHVLEQYLTFPVDARVQDYMAEGILKTLIEVGPRTYHDKNDIDARKNFMWAATNALNGLIGVGVPQDWSTHLIGHELTSLFNIAHGRTLAIIIPSLLRERKCEKYDKLLQYSDRVWGIKDGSDDERIEKAIYKTEEFFNLLGIGTHLSDYDIGENEIKKVISNLERVGSTAISERGDLTLDIVKKILKRAK